jgi:hypothetical protein
LRDKFCAVPSCGIPRMNIVRATANNDFIFQFSLGWNG